MISSVRGVVQSVDDESVVLEVGGIGLRIEVPTTVLDTHPEIGSPFYLHTTLDVREDSLRLYGFLHLDDLEVFNLVNQVSGIGPRLGLAILSHLNRETLQTAISTNRPELLTQVPGIGRKTAEKIIFHLKDRLAGEAGIDHVIRKGDSEVLDVLTALGYNLVEAQSAVQSIPKEAPEDIEERVRLALQHFSKRST